MKWLDDTYNIIDREMMEIGLNPISGATIISAILIVKYTIQFILQT